MKPWGAAPMSIDYVDARRESESLRRWRQTQYARRCRSQAWLLDRVGHGRKLTIGQLGALPRPARCGWPLTGVGIRLYEGRAFLHGAQHCASPWACPLCTPVIRRRRAQDLRHAVHWWQQTKDAHGLVFVTLTVPHSKSERLGALIDLVAGSWSRMRGSHAWRRLADRTGIRHHVRSMEITWSPTSGWHAHLHVLLFTETMPDAKTLKRSIHVLWAEAVHALDPDRKPVSKRHGVIVESVTDEGLLLAEYMSKTPDKRDIALEMTRGDRKQGRRAGSMNPFELLDDGIDLNERTTRALWCEYVDSTYRRRTITWSRKLRTDSGLAGTEPTDRQIIDDAIHGTPVISLTAPAYRMLRRSPSIIAATLQLVEDGQVPLAETVIGQATGMDMDSRS